MRESIRKHDGFTLMELMLALAVMGILLGIALPAVNSWVASAKVKSAVSDLYSSIIKARSEALKRNRDIVVGPVAAWPDGWTVKLGATTLAQQQATSGVTIVVLQRSGTTWSENTGSLTFKPTGRVDVAAEQIAFVVSAIGSGSRCVDISPSGRPSVRVDADGSTTNACD